MIDLTPFDQANCKLKTGLYYAGSESLLIDEDMREVLRSRAILAFEYTYELSIKMIRRYLEATEPDGTSPQEMTFTELIRRAYELGLIASDLEQWRAWRKARGTTSHTYDEARAMLVFEDLGNFYKEMVLLLEQLNMRNDRI